jgi:hypothetical protein
MMPGPRDLPVLWIPRPTGEVEAQVSVACSGQALGRLREGIDMRCSISATEARGGK